MQDQDQAPVIKIFNSMIVIENYVGNKTLEQNLTIKDDVSWETKFIFMRSTVNDANYSTTLIIPRCYNIKKLNELIGGSKYYIENTYDVKSVSLKSRYEPRDALQRSALDWLLNSQAYFSQSVLHLRTDDGKTYIALKYICEVGEPSLILVHDVNTMNQWIERIQQLTYIKEDEIGIFQGKDSIPKVWAAKNKKIWIGIHRTMTNWIEREPKELHTFCIEKGIGIKIVDECHLELQSIWIEDCHLNIPDNIYLSGTAERTKWKENIAMNNLLPIYFAFGKGSAEVREKDKYHTATFMSYDTNISQLEEAGLTTNRGFNQNNWAAYSIKHINLLFDIVLSIIMKIHKEHGETTPVAIICKSLDQCKNFQNRLAGEGFEVGMYTSLHSNVETRPLELTKQVVLTTDKSLKAAIDSEIDVMINLIPMASKGGVLQLIGRLRKRGLGIYYDLWDRSIDAHTAMKLIRAGVLRKICKDQICEVKYEPPKKVVAKKIGKSDIKVKESDGDKIVPKKIIYKRKKR